MPTAYDSGEANVPSPFPAGQTPVSAWLRHDQIDLAIFIESPLRSTKASRRRRSRLQRAETVHSPLPRRTDDPSVFANARSEWPSLLKSPRKAMSGLAQGTGDGLLKPPCRCSTGWRAGFWSSPQPPHSHSPGSTKVARHDEGWIEAGPRKSAAHPVFRPLAEKHADGALRIGWHHNVGLPSPLMSATKNTPGSGPAAYSTPAANFALPGSEKTVIFPDA